ncbi:MAG: RHS repeat-associated core domain-containing protein [Deltaproteobacteria bacterium]|nr:RHS repeat-associated core domain-containing protein [Deltaproteobacteria bacterium]
MTSANTQVAPSLSAPPFAGAQSNIDLFGFAGTVEVGGAPSTRSRDALGNVTFTPLEDGDATLKFDGFSRLREVDRADDAVITYGYRPDGMLVSRVVVCNSAPGCAASNRTFVYAGLLLLEEYEGTALAARYFYGDGSDIPIAADLFDANLGALRRVYYATDRMGSIVGVMDSAGALIERVSYDPYGRPTIEAGDADPPQVSSIERQANGDLLVAFTEAVLPPPSTTAGTTIVNSLASLSGAVTLLRDVSGTMTAVAGTWSYEEAAAGFDHGTVLRFVPGESLAAGSAVALSVNGGGLIDSWSNGTSAVTLNFNIGAGVLYTGPPQGSTSTPVIERSLVGNGLLFQAHLWDADAGLYLARARVLDPTTGTFLQRDPSGYSDSVNLYAFTAGDPVNHRDPTGKQNQSGFGTFEECMQAAGEASGLQERCKAQFCSWNPFGDRDRAWCGRDAAEKAKEAVGQLAGQAGGAVAEMLLGSVADATGVTVQPGRMEQAVKSGSQAGESAGRDLTELAIEETKIVGPEKGFEWMAVLLRPFMRINLLSKGSKAAEEAAMSIPQTLGRGSTANLSKGTTLARNLREQLAIEQAMSSPAAGTRLRLTMTDPRWPGSEGWVKMQQVMQPGGEPINVHYLFNEATGAIDDFKIVLPGRR